MFDPLEHLIFSGQGPFILFVFSGHLSSLSSFSLLTQSTKLQNSLTGTKNSPALSACNRTCMLLGVQLGMHTQQGPVSVVCSCHHMHVPVYRSQSCVWTSLSLPQGITQLPVSALFTLMPHGNSARCFLWLAMLAVK